MLPKITTHMPTLFGEISQGQISNEPYDRSAVNIYIQAGLYVYIYTQTM